MGKPSAYSQKIVGRAILWAFAAAIFVKFFLVDFMVAEGQSMTPAIKPGTVLIVNRIYYGIRLPWTGNYVLQWKAIREGDVVIFYTPHGDIAVKRCVEILEEEMFIALGDNTYHSYDSRNYGPVPKNNIIGKVVTVR